MLSNLLRQCITISSTKEQHSYWAYGLPIWAKLNKHIIQAPLFRSRHNREIQLSQAVSAGTLPSRLHTFLLLALVASNVVYCCLLDYNGQSRAALIAELRGRSGHLAVVNMLALVLFAARNNPLIPILAVSFDTFNLLHRWIGRIVVLESVVHITAWLVNNFDALGYSGIQEVFLTDTFVQCGLTSTIALMIMLIQSPSAIRHAFYEVFLHTHQVLAVVALGATTAHIQAQNLPQKPIIYTIIGIWASERSLRIIRLLYYNVSCRGCTKAYVQALDGGACRVTFTIRRRFTTSPGRHIYAYIPSVSYWMSHPFSVATVNDRMYMTENSPITSPSPSILGDLEALSKRSPEQSTHRISCVMAARTGMTGKLFNKAKSAPGGLYTCLALIEGPYGASDSLDSYGTVLLFAGGVGITHQLSHMYQLVRGWAAGTTATQKLVLIWSIRSLEQLQWVLPWLEELSQSERYGRVLEIVVCVTKLRVVKQLQHVPEIQMKPGRADVQRLVNAHFEERVGAMTIGICGPGALTDDVRSAARMMMCKGKVDFWEEAFTW